MPVRMEINQEFVMYDMYQWGDRHDEEFYPSPDPSQHPSEDIWKKFELLPTPPLSPQRESDDWDISEAERHQLVTNLLDDDLMSTTVVNFTDFEYAGLSKNLQSNVIKDCMWSAKITDTEDKSKTSNATTTKLTIRSTVRRDSISGSLSREPSSNASQCVDPTSVFPYPVSQEVSSRDSLGTETPSDSEEEIDVVTVEKKQQLTPVFTVRRKAPPTPEAIKQALADHSEMHNYTRPPSTRPTVTRITLNGSVGLKRPCSNPSSPQSVKKFKRDINLVDLKSAVRRLHQHGGYSVSGSRGSSLASSRASSLSSSRASSDSEDCEKRSQHNVLERKRREDLKSNFLGLKDMVPHLSQGERAPKVVILKKAADFIVGLGRTEQRLVHEKRTEEARKEQLLARLHKLKQECYHNVTTIPIY